MKSKDSLQDYRESRKDNCLSLDSVNGSIIEMVGARPHVRSERIRTALTALMLDRALRQGRGIKGGDSET